MPMNFFEQELRKLFDDGSVIEAPTFAGRACLGVLGNDLRVRAEFVTTGVQMDYTALLVRVIDPKRNGEIDRILLQFIDIWGLKLVRHPSFPDGVLPRISDDHENPRWLVYTPTSADMDVLRQQVRNFLEIYRDRPQEKKRETAKVVYLCAPLHGDVKANMEFARQKANEELAAGNIPVCPHFLMPPSVKINQPKQVQAAQEMGMQMLESCREIHVFGEEWTDRMWAEINRATQLGIPVMTDQKEIRRPNHRLVTPVKGKGGGPQR